MTGATDLDGNLRINKTVNLGCYECYLSEGFQLIIR